MTLPDSLDASALEGGSGGPAPSWAVQCLDDRTRVALRYAEEGERWTVWRATTLFPVAKGRHADADHLCKLDLRLAKAGAQALYVERFECSDTRGPERSTADPAGLFDAGEQGLECGSLHVNSSRTRRASIRA